MHALFVGQSWKPSDADLEFNLLNPQIHGFDFKNLEFGVFVGLTQRNEQP